ncbi:MAG: peptide-methionine (S)-S-oxide reductase MsrA [Oscillospiraceae bacterium]|nr:peptide-methionine (S)-S-oxide reductase MsrA [Oscillospiraceae bacterium]MDD4367320.1 peptide-methionine (S)-S-oxide reductase MsrA [Oscillospiraceae bacterium]
MIKDIYLAGGCFWGLEQYLRQIRGVVATEVGYANGHPARGSQTVSQPDYQTVCQGRLGFAETVHVSYDDRQLTLARLLELYLQAIDPWAINQQGPDCGIQYRTGIYYQDQAAQAQAQALLDTLARTSGRTPAVGCQPLLNYFAAEPYHQRYLEKNPDGYCHISPQLMAAASQANPEQNV